MIKKLDNKFNLVINNKYTIVLGLIICISLIFTFLNFPSVKASDLNKYQEELEKIKSEQKANIDKMQGIEKEIAQDQYDMIELDQKVTKFSNELEQLQSKVDGIKTKLEEQEKSLQEAAQKFNSAEEVYATRLRLIYENGIPSIIDIFFASEGISDFFSRMNVLTSILDYDKSLVGNMQSQKEYVDYIKKDIETQKLQLEQLTYDKEKSTVALNNAVKAKEDKLATLNSNKSNLEEKNKKLKAQEVTAKKKIDEEIAKELAKANNYSGEFTGQFTWPSPGIYHITAAFDDKEYLQIVGMHHTGVDMGTPIGTPLVAASDGVVLIAGYNNGGYGNYVVIDHGVNSSGARYVTLYGHMSSTGVTKGQKVSKGTRIGLSGNSGFSSGPHLHFEINRISNKTMTSLDAMDFFIGSGASFTYSTGSGRIAYPFANMSKYQYSKQLKRSYSY